MKTMMKTMMGVLVLSSVFCVSADSLYEDIAYIGCSETDEEGVAVLEGEVKWYADFKNNTIIEPQPSFINHIPQQDGIYETAVAQLQSCRFNLNIERNVFKDLPLERDGYMHYSVYSCEFNSTDLKDIEFIVSHYYNKVKHTSFSSSVGKYFGFTEYGVKKADFWNNDPSILAFMNAQREVYCLFNVGLDYNDALTKTVTPYVRLHSVASPGGKHPAMLVCSVFDFYPKQIRVSWRRDGKEVSSDVTSTDELADGDWYYQIHSHLEYTPRSGEKISCVVDHASLKQLLVTDWDPSMPESKRNKIAIGASGLILGLTLSLAGFIYYKRKARGRILVPSN